jgi:hypothetical protein
MSLEVHFTSNKDNPIFVEDVYGNTILIHKFILEDDDDWKEFIGKLDAIRQSYLFREAQKKYLKNA